MSGVFEFLQFNHFQHILRVSICLAYFGIIVGQKPCSIKIAFFILAVQATPIAHAHYSYPRGPRMPETRRRKRGRKAIFETLWTHLDSTRGRYLMEDEEDKPRSNWIIIQHMLIQ